MTTPSIRGIIYDLDGTLADTLPDLTAACNAALRMLGYPERTNDEIRAFIGDGARKLCRRCLPEDLRADDVLADKVHAGHVAYYRDHLTPLTRPYNGIHDMLRHFDRLGISQAVLSNKPHDFAVEIVLHFFSDIHWKALFGGRNNVPLKPDPASALETAAILGLSPSEILFLGDSPQDVRTARNAGMLAGAVTWGFASEKLIESDPDILFDSVEKIIDFIEKHR